MTRVDLVDAISPNRLGSDKSQWDPDVLSRSEAEEVVNAVFAEIVEALLKGETVDLPIGTFEVQKRKTPTLSGQLLKIEFTPDEWMIVELNEPAGRRKRTGSPPVPRKKKIRKFKPYPREEAAIDDNDHADGAHKPSAPATEREHVNGQVVVFIGRSHAGGWKTAARPFALRPETSGVVPGQRPRAHRRRL